MTKQEYYDLLVKSAQDGTFPSYEDSECRYRADRTALCKRRCAVGVIIPDESYSTDMEGCGVSSALIDPWIPDGMTLRDMGFVQDAHDTLADCHIETWKASKFVMKLNLLNCFADVTKITLPED